MGKKSMIRGIPRLMILLFFLNSLVFVGIAAIDSGTETLLSVNLLNHAQYNPDISGNNIVWSDNVDGSLHLYNIFTGNETTIHNDGFIFTIPSISGNFIVSEAFNPATYFDIFLYNIFTGEGSILTPDSEYSDEISPVVNGRYVAWKSYDYLDSTCNVFLYDLAIPTNPAIRIANDTQSCGCVEFPDPNCSDPNKSPSPSFSPSISSSYVVWDALVDSRYDIFLYNITSKTTLNITPDTSDSDQEFPEISENYVVWQDNRNGNWNVYLADISNIGNITMGPIDPDASAQYYPTIDENLVVWRDLATESLKLYDIQSSSILQITPSSRNPNNPSISGNRIVYEGREAPTGFTQVYLFTYGAFVECPIANFTNLTPRTAVSAPYSVQFNDISYPQPNITAWNFGDGTPNFIGVDPIHTFTAMGTYDISLIVSTDYCRNMTVKNDYVSIGQRPVVNFVGTPTCGIMPLTVSFLDKSSGNPTSWSWDFDNDSIDESTVQNPQFIFTKGGSYSVNMTAINSMGQASLLKHDYISVMNRSDIVLNTTINGLLITDGAHLTLNTTEISDYSLNDKVLKIIPPIENNLYQIVLVGDDSEFIINGDEIEGNITKVYLTSASIPIMGFGEDVGSDAYFNFTLEMPSYPVGGTIIPYIFENALPCDEHDLNKISYDSGFSELSRTAYEFRLVKDNIGTVSNMSINLAVNSSWVTNRSKVWVIRIGDDKTGEVLPTWFIGEDTVHHLDIFSAYSPRGPSSFALTTLSQSGNPLQIIVLIVQQLFSPGSDSSSDGVPTFTPRQTPTPTPTPTPVPTTSAPEGTGILPIDSEGILTESIEIRSEDLSGTLSIFAGTKALSANGTTLSNISIRRLDAEEIASLPLEEGFQGIAFELLPDGATFDTPIVFTLVVPADTWSDSKRYLLQWYNRTSEQWEPISTTSIADSHTLIAQLGHFSIIGLFSYEIPTTTVTTEIPTTSPPVTTTPSSLFVGLLAVGVGIVWWTRGRR
jgi:beta propeller repeat protein